MALVDRCRREFDAGDRSRGEAYFLDEMVHLRKAQANRITAEVEGSYDYYQVEIDWSQVPAGLLKVSCACPRFADGYLCKHLWATLLEMDRTGNAQRVTGSNRLRLVMGGELLDGEDDFTEQLLGYLETGDNSATLGSATLGVSQGNSKKRTTKPGKATRRNGKSGGKSPRKKDAPPAWQQTINQFFHFVRENAEDWQEGGESPKDWQRQFTTKQREAWYVLDVSACVQERAVVIELRQRERKKNGEFGKFKQLGLSDGVISKFSDPVDHELLTQLRELPDPGDDFFSYQYRYQSYQPQTTSVRLPTTVYESLLPRLAATERLVWQIDSELPTSEAFPVAWDDGPAWQFRAELVPNDKQKKWTLAGSYLRGNEKRPLTDGVLPTNTGLLLMDNRLARLETPAGAFEWLVLLLSAPTPIEIPYRDRDAFLEQFWSADEVPPFELPASFACQELHKAPQPALKVHAPSETGYGANRRKLSADVTFYYGDQEIAVAAARRGVVRTEQDETQVLVRDRAAEATRLAELVEWGVEPTAPVGDLAGDVKFSHKQLGKVVDGLLASGWRVEAEGKLFRTAGEFKIEVTSEIDWFELDAQIDFDGIEATLPELLTAVRKGEKYVELGDGSRGLLPAKWLDRYAPLVDLGDVEAGAVRFQPSQALLLDTLLAEQQSGLQIDRKFRQFRQRLRSFAGVEPRQEPSTFQGTLRDYQRAGLGWFHFLQKLGLGGCLADDMGLGKTIQVLALLEQRRTRRMKKGETRRPTLVVVPKSLIFNWIDEAARFTPKLRVADYTGSDRRQSVGAFDDYHLIVTTYGTLRRDIAELKNYRFDYVLLDEAQAIKNASSQTAKACQLLNSEHRLALTGTPIENHLGELWSLFEFLNPGMLGHSKAFGTLCQSNGTHDSDLPENSRLKDLAQAVAPFILRRTKQQVLQELPEKTEQTLYCDLLPKDRKAYNELRDFYRAKLAKKIDQRGFKQSKIHVLEALLRLRQASCHIGLVDNKKASQPSAKLETLLQQVREVVAEGHKALVFSQFTSLLSIVRDQLESEGIVYEYLDGRTRKRKEKVERFQTDEACPLFLISLKAGGSGLNLTAADYVFILDPWWNPAVEAQAIDRTHRMGQTRHVFAYRIIARDTVEEKVLELQKGKRELAEAIVTADESLIRNLTADDLQLILS